MTALKSVWHTDALASTHPTTNLNPTTDAAFLDACTSIGLSTVYLRTDKRDWKTGRKATYEIRDGELKNVQAFVEELNGVSFRAASLL